MKTANELRQVLLQLPVLSARAASNHQFIQRCLQNALEHLVLISTSGNRDGAVRREVGCELDELQRMLDDQRDTFDRMRSAETIVDTTVHCQPAETYLHLYKSAVMAGDFAAAAPWFNRYCEQMSNSPLGGIAAKKSRSASRWRGPLNRLR